jgi:hypothetical protein
VGGHDEHSLSFKRHYYGPLIDLSMFGFRDVWFSKLLDAVTSLGVTIRSAYLACQVSCVTSC